MNTLHIPTLKPRAIDAYDRLCLAYRYGGESSRIAARRQLEQEAKRLGFDTSLELDTAWSNAETVRLFSR